MKRPAGRPFASSPEPESRSLQAVSVTTSAAEVSPFPRPSRISSQRLDSLSERLTDADRAVLLLLSEVRLATGFQIARRLWNADSPTDSRARAARRSLALLENLRVIERVRHRIGGVRRGSQSITYGVGPTGYRLLGRLGFEPRRLGTPGERHIAHTLAITELVVRLHRAAIDGDLDLIEVQAEPACWRSFLGAMGSRMTLKPDLFLRVGCGALEDRWFVEVDLATESRATLSAKAKRYVIHYRCGEEQRRHGVYPRVIWTVPDAKRREQLEEVLSELPPAAQRLFVVWPFDECLGRIIAECTE
jgi:hypothetical protein